MLGLDKVLAGLRAYAEGEGFCVVRGLAGWGFAEDGGGEQGDEEADPRRELLEGYVGTSLGAGSRRR